MARRCNPIRISTCAPSGICDACKEIINTSCVKYTGGDLINIDVESGDTLTEILNKIDTVINLGDGGSLSLFPNGVKMVTESRELAADDAGYLLYLQGDSIIINFPTVIPLSQGQHFGILISEDETCGWTVGENEALNRALESEVVLFGVVDFEGIPYAFPISTVMFDDGNGGDATAINSFYNFIRYGNLPSNPYSQWESEVSSQIKLGINKNILITDRCDLGLILTTNKTGLGGIDGGTWSPFEIKGVGGYLNCDYSNVGINAFGRGAYSGVEPLTGVACSTIGGQWVRDETEKGSIFFDTLVGGIFAVGETITETTNGATFKVLGGDNGSFVEIVKTNSQPFDGTGTFDNGTGVTANVTSNISYYNINTGYIVFWDNNHYQLIDLTLMNGDTPSGNLAAYYLLERTVVNVGYQESWDEVDYHFESDLISRRTDRTSSITGSENIIRFPWGNGGISIIMENNNLDDTYLDVRNCSGGIDGKIFGSLNGIYITENQNDCLIRINGTEQNVYINGNKANLELHIEGFGVGIYGEKPKGSIKAYLKGDSYLNITETQETFNGRVNLYSGSNLNAQYNSGTISGDFYDGVEVDAHGGAGDILNAVFAKGNYTAILNMGETWNKCEFTHSGTFTLPADQSFDSKELSNNASTLNVFRDITGLTELDINADWAGIISLTSTNTTETISTIINQPLGFPFVIAPFYNGVNELSVTIESTDADTAVADDICLEANTDIVLKARAGDRGDFLQASSDGTITRQIGGSIL